jgi:hypothetical protein
MLYGANAGWWRSDGDEQMWHITDGGEGGDYIQRLDGLGTEKMTTMATVDGEE